MKIHENAGFTYIHMCVECLDLCFVCLDLYFGCLDLYLYLGPMGPGPGPGPVPGPGPGPGPFAVYGRLQISPDPEITLILTTYDF